MEDYPVLEIKVDNIRFNLDYFRSKLDPGTKIMVMVKAFGYGTGNPEVSDILESAGVDYLGVAFTHEGVRLRKAGIKTPIMVMNPNPGLWNLASDYDLELEIYSLKVLSELNNFSKLHSIPFKVQIKIETGMYRLGFERQDLVEMCSILNNNELLEVTAILSHLSSAEVAKERDYTQYQILEFLEFSSSIMQKLKMSIPRHILNTAGIICFPEHQFEMVRLGIGVYGVNTVDTNTASLKTVCTLKSVISQIKTLKKGDTVGYGRAGVVEENHTRIATVAMGYADGFYRSLGNGNSRVWINGQWAKTFGKICMDMFMVNVTGLDVREGDEVEIFGENQSINDLAMAANTIPYELLTSVGERVKRTYI